MTSNWEIFKANDFCFTVTDGTHDSPKAKENGHYLITSKHLAPYNIDFSSAKKISEEDYQKVIKRSPVEQWDILFSMIGTIGITYIEKNTAIDYACKNMGIFKFNGDKDKAYWLYYYLQTPQAKEYILGHLRGTTQQYLPLGSLRDFPIQVPSAEIRNKITSILRSFDDRIAVNTAINENLEQQAQALLKEFMNRYNYSLAPLSEISEVIDCLHSKKPERVYDSNRQLLQLENIKDNGFLDLSYQFMISESDYNNWTRKCEIHEGDCVITNVGRIGAVAQAPRDTNVAMGRNMTCIRLKPQYKIPAFLITVLLSEHMKREIRYNTDEGTIMGALNVKNIPKLQFPFFEEKVMYELENILYVIRKQFEENSIQNQRLAALRDTLLPKLMSGEIDVSAVEI